VQWQARPRRHCDLAARSRNKIDELTTDDGKNAAAVALGRMGGKARAEALGKRKRTEIARKAAKKRWTKRTPVSAE
jgi:hypothetical protein